MTLDRTGEPLEAPAHHCRNGWLTPDDADVARLCPCRSSRTTEVRDSVPSARAQAAIDRAERADRNRNNPQS